MRILFSIKWPLRALNRGPKGYRFEIDWEKLLEIYPFLNHAIRRLAENQEFLVTLLTRLAGIKVKAVYERVIEELG